MKRRHRLWSGIALVCLLLPLASGQNPGPAAGTTPRLAGIDLAVYRHLLQRGFQPLDRLFIVDSTGYFLVPGARLEALKRHGVPFVLHDFDRLNERDRRQTASSNGAYHSHLETLVEMDELAARHPGRARVFSIGFSLEGREIYVMKISDHVEEEEDEPNLIVMGCHHAREWISVEVPLGFCRHLLDQYDLDPQVKRAVDGAQIYVLPIQNPDGLEYSIHTYRMWRKNRRYNGDLSWGVDTNRNYGHMWGYDDIGSSPDPQSGVYRGPAPFSEPETVAVRDFLQNHPPSGSLSFHNYSQLILYPWGYADLPTIDDEEFNQIARTMAERIAAVNGRIYTYGAGATTIYPTNGDMDDWVYATFGAPAFTIELPPELFIEGGFLTSEETIASVVAEMLPAMDHFVNHIITRQVNGRRPGRQ